MCCHPKAHGFLLLLLSLSLLSSSSSLSSSSLSSSSLLVLSLFDQIWDICHPKTPHFGIFDQKWQICLKNQIKKKKNPSELVIKYIFFFFILKFCHRKTPLKKKNPTSHPKTPLFEYPLDWKSGASTRVCMWQCLPGTDWWSGWGLLGMTGIPWTIHTRCANYAPVAANLNWRCSKYAKECLCLDLYNCTPNTSRSAYRHVGIT